MMLIVRSVQSKVSAIRPFLYRGSLDVATHTVTRGKFVHHFSSSTY